MNLDEGLEPAWVDVAGIKVAFVAFNDVGGVVRADADTAGVPWITGPTSGRPSAALATATPT